MAEYEEDFYMRQVQGMAKGLGKFLSDDSIDDILEFGDEESESRQGEDEENQSEK